MDDLLAEFLTETSEGLAELDAALLRLERVPDDQETLSLIFRVFHTIKGNCGFFGLARMTDITHAAETALGRLRDGQLRATPALVSVTLRAVDEVKAIVAGVRASNAEPPGDDEALITALHALASDGEAARAEAAAPAPADAFPDAAGQDSMPTSDAQASGAQTIRVSVDALENLMALVSELVLTRNQLLQLARTRDDTVLETALQRLSHLTADFQEGVSKARMQPIHAAWAKLPRLVRDLGQQLGKQIELRTRGQDTELDRQVLDMIRDPLVHMVRNSADHGLERPAERRAAGKPEKGCIELEARQDGGQIVIEVSDDGRGLDLNQIRARALDRSFASAAELAAMTEIQLCQMIFRPGFSTAAEVTAISGRGVGMDVVKANVERIGGSIQLRSTLGRGSCFTIVLPLTLAISSALIVEVAGERFAIPQAGVLELVRARFGSSGVPDNEETARIELIEGTPLLRLRDRMLPLASLATLLQLVAPAEAPRAGEHVSVVVLSAGGQTLGLIVDDVFDTEEIVVKPVAPILQHVTMFSGNTILGDGSVVMILDPNGIMRATGMGSTGDVPRVEGAAAASAATDDGSTTLLLFRADAEHLLAVPLAQVVRLEQLPREHIECVDGRFVMQYRGELMPVACFDGSDALARAIRGDLASVPLLVLGDGERAAGLAVEEILDVVADRVELEFGGSTAGVRGSAVIAGRATDVLDVEFWLHRASRTKPPADPLAGRLLCIGEDGSARERLVSALEATRHRVLAVPGPEHARALREAGVPFDAIVVSVTPDLADRWDGLARDLPSASWSGLPVILLGDPAAVTGGAGPRAGSVSWVRKDDQRGLLGAVDRCLRASAGEGA